MHPRDVGLLDWEYQTIVSLMGRKPNDLELGLYGALWSEHCSYKSSKSLLSRLPHGGQAVVQGPGENAGVVQLSESLEIAFKIESHNHPSSVEPVQGAATGVGGILRDIIAMGARPIAVADALRFGIDAHSMALLRGVVKGVGDYGNAIGIPTVTGDIGFSPTYRTNPLVNVLAVGMRRPADRIGASTATAGSQLVLLGQRTGREGIHGASLLASQDFSLSDTDLRPTVQVGDPFLGKLLMEATLEAVHSRILVALQDLGAAGLTSAVAELCYASGVGAELWLDRVPLREPGLTPYEIMLSETQERMLMAVSEEHLKDLSRIAEHWEVPMTVIGEIRRDERLVLRDQGETVADVAPVFLAGRAPRREVDNVLWECFKHPVKSDLKQVVARFSTSLLLEVLSALDVRDRSSVYQQYDSSIQTNTVMGPGHDGAVLRIRSEKAGIFIAVAGPGRWAAVDAYAGGAGAVVRVLAALAAQGADALGLTDGVNAGNPDKEDSYRALGALIRGVSDAAEALGVPVTGGNVSLHNETQGESIWPTVIIGGVGRHHEPLNPMADVFKHAGDVLFLVNPGPLDWGGSVAELVTGGLTKYPRPDWDRDLRAMRVITHLVKERRVGAARVVGEGGLGVAVARMMMEGAPSLGAHLTLTEADREDKTRRFYNEAPAQWIVVIDPRHVAPVREELQRQGVGFEEIGKVTEDALLVVDARYQWTRADMSVRWRQPYREVEQ